MAAHTKPEDHRTVYQRCRLGGPSMPCAPAGSLLPTLERPAAGWHPARAAYELCGLPPWCLPCAGEDTIGWVGYASRPRDRALRHSARDNSVSGMEELRLARLAVVGASSLVNRPFPRLRSLTLPNLVGREFGEQFGLLHATPTRIRVSGGRRALKPTSEVADSLVKQGSVAAYPPCSNERRYPFLLAEGETNWRRLEGD